MMDNSSEKILAQAATEFVNERRVERRWRIGFRLLTFAIIIWVVSAATSDEDSTFKAVSSSGGDSDDYVAVIDIYGEIGEQNKLASSDNTGTSINELVRRAFADEEATGIILNLDSPGGSAFDSYIVYQEIVRLRALYPDKPIHAVAGNLCASGCYMIAAAAQNIYVNQATLVGSIGVRLDTFGFVGAMEKLGVERRSYTAGENKAILDPYQPEHPATEKYIVPILHDFHAIFIDTVTTGRGDRLTDDPDIFTGSIYSGTKSIELGLVDGLGTVHSVARDVFNTENLEPVRESDSVLERFLQDVESSMSSLLGVDSSSESGLILR